MTAPCESCRAELSAAARFCPACGTPVRASDSPTMTTDRPFVAAHPVGRLASSDTVAVGGFTPGVVLDGRYRIIGLIGRGGMGEVYRADDLKLGQPVALKFLPPAVHDDPVRRERFVAEVRIARQVSHPNVCRVYDLSEVEGRHFLSMEYIDGEDLASLLTRIGHLPAAKALEMARQLCAGLAAAHDKGVLHRDLKPANVMIDGRGRVRITDFGLAVAGEANAPTGVIEGTPAYMAPEQLAGAPATVQSDLYALGLILYEICTGARAFKARSLAELRAERDSDTITAPSEITRDLDPIIERVILRCLDRDPRARPSSAVQVAAALPGGDPLAAALAAGETPSPEMVAASATSEGLRPLVAWALLLVTVAGVALAIWFAPRASLWLMYPPTKPPEVMAERAREVLRRLGFPEDATASAHGFAMNTDHRVPLRERGAPATVWAAAEERGVRFWYRQSPQAISRLDMLGPGQITRITPDDPGLKFSGEVRVFLDRTGRLIGLTAVPDQKTSEAAPAQPDVDWAVVFAEAGLDMAGWRPVPPEWSPLFYADQRTAWAPAQPDDWGPVRVEAASFRGRPVRFEILYAFDQPTRMQPYERTAGERATIAFLIALLLSIVIGATWVARRNLRMGRGDYRGALRLAGYSMALLSITWLLDEHHQTSPHEVFLLYMQVGRTLFVGGLIAVLYLAVEPYVRRNWPTLIVSWSRVLAGRLRDPLVARDVLFGCAAGALTAALDSASYTWLDALPIAERPLLGGRHVVSQFAQSLLNGLSSSLMLLFVLFAFKMLLKRDWLAIAAAVVLLSGPTALSTNAPVIALVIGLAFSAILMTLLARVGLVALVAAGIVGTLLFAFPITYATQAWFATTGLVGIGAVMALTGAAFAYARAK